MPRSRAGLFVLELVQILRHLAHRYVLKRNDEVRQHRYFNGYPGFWAESELCGSCICYRSASEAGGCDEVAAPFSVLACLGTQTGQMWI
jgi:hypothetical protein